MFFPKRLNQKCIDREAGSRYYGKKCVVLDTNYAKPDGTLVLYTVCVNVKYERERRSVQRPITFLEPLED